MPATNRLGLSSKNLTLDTETLGSSLSLGSEKGAISAGKPCELESMDDSRLTSHI